MRAAALLAAAGALLLAALLGGGASGDSRLLWIGGGAALAAGIAAAASFLGALPRPSPGRCRRRLPRARGRLRGVERSHDPLVGPARPLVGLHEPGARLPRLRVLRALPRSGAAPRAAQARVPVPRRVRGWRSAGRCSARRSRRSTPTTGGSRGCARRSATGTRSRRCATRRCRSGSGSARAGAGRARSSSTARGRRGAHALAQRARDRGPRRSSSTSRSRGTHTEGC